MPFLVRHSGGSAFPVDWTSVANLRPAQGSGAAAKPTPGARASASDSAAEYAAEQEKVAEAAQRKWVDLARADLDGLRARWIRQLRELAPEARGVAREKFDRDQQVRLADLARAERVKVSAPQLIGWLDVRPGAAISEIGYDPDSEVPAIELVMATLDSAGYDVDDRQTAGLGYDLFARHRVTNEQRLVEVKGQLEGLGPVTLESNEWAQAMQRGQEFWLYIVTDCGTVPTLAATIQDPAGVLTGGPRLIERFQIPVSQLRKFVGEQQ
jgi:hypothetical protein